MALGKLTSGKKLVNMANNRISTSNAARGNDAAGRRRKITQGEALDRSSATGTTPSTSEEILAVADDRETAAAGGPTYDEIAQAAYERYLNRGGEHGQDLDDWVAAERELNDRRRR